MDPKVVLRNYTQDFYTQVLERIKDKIQAGYSCEMDCYTKGQDLELSDSCAEICKSLHIPLRQSLESSLKSLFKTTVTNLNNCKRDSKCQESELSLYKSSLDSLLSSLNP